MWRAPLVALFGVVVFIALQEEASVWRPFGCVEASLSRSAIYVSVVNHDVKPIIKGVIQNRGRISCSAAGELLHSAQSVINVDKSEVKSQFNWLGFPVDNRLFNALIVTRTARSKETRACWFQKTRTSLIRSTNPAVAPPTPRDLSWVLRTVTPYRSLDQVRRDIGDDGGCLANVSHDKFGREVSCGDFWIVSRINFEWRRVWSGYPYECAAGSRSSVRRFGLAFHFLKLSVHRRSLFHSSFGLFVDRPVHFAHFVKLKLKNHVGDRGEKNSEGDQGYRQIFSKAFPPLISVVVFVCANVGLFYCVKRRKRFGVLLMICFFELSFLALLYEFGFPFPDHDPHSMESEVFESNPFQF